jgi:phosphoserine phosphatase RsbX
MMPKIIEWAVASRPLPGQTESGDRHWVRTLSGKVLVAVVDGLGHGGEAAAAAKIAVSTLDKHGGEPPADLILCCCQSLVASRGVVMSLAYFNALDDTMTWLGVGNVEGVLIRGNVRATPGQETLLLRPGVVGDRQPRLSPSVVQVAAGDLLIFATDGIRAGFAENICSCDSPQRIADRILAECALETDDALVLVARYLHAQDKTTRG